EAHAAETLKPMSTGPTAVHEVAGEVCRSLAITAAEKGARLQVRGRGSCDCDPDALARVLINLVENALKFGATEVEVVCGSQGVDVLDNGPGFTEEDLGRAFSKFARLSARPTGGEPSTGLGLFIVRSLVEAMGGEVELTNREPRGARFTLRLAQSSRGGS
ncbi:MAG: HAMP domain-containing histidine kinase, partial [Deltaproteobacteria bacterium]|nr:HAMP domain-containing histidine kinase [Deltaproteobacteria bacterium]